MPVVRQPVPTPVVIHPPKPTAPIHPPPAQKIDESSLAPLNLPSKPLVYIDDSIKSTPSADLSNDSRMDEKAKLESILMDSMAKTEPIAPTNANRFQAANKNWIPNRQPQHTMVNPLNRPLPLNYLCSICRKPGHHKHHCPEAGTLPRPEERPKFPSGIPRTNLIPAQKSTPFAMLGPEGYVVSTIEHKAAKIVKKDKPSFMDDEEEEEENSKSKEQQTNTAEQVSQIPADLKCPFGEHIIKDAVLVPCCGHFVCCDECIKQKILNDENIECPYEKCDLEIGSLVSITPFHETRKKVNDYLNELKKSQKPTSPSAGSHSADPFLDLILSEVNEKVLQTI